MTMQGTELKALRKQAHMTQAEAAEALAVSQPFLGQMERDAKPIEKRTAKLVDEVLRPRIDVTYSDAVGGWLVTTVRPLPGVPGRRHDVIGRFDHQPQAIDRANELASEMVGARVLIHPRR